MSFHHPRTVDRKDLEEVVKSRLDTANPGEQPVSRGRGMVELDHRRLNRLLLEQLLPGCLRPIAGGQRGPR